MTPFLSHFLEQQRFKAIAPYLSGDVLDLGCNTAWIIEKLKPGQRYIGIDSQPDVLDWLKVHRNGYEFILMDLDHEEIALPDQFDTILMLAVIEHLTNPGNILRQVSRYLKPGGHLLITTPSHFGDRLHRIGAKISLTSTAAVEDHEHIFTYNEMKKLLNENGMSVKTCRRFLLRGNQVFICNLSNDQGML